MIALLHAHGSIDSESIIDGLLNEVLLDGFLDALKIIPFLFLTYLLMEFIEHKASGKTLTALKKSGTLGPAIGGILGILPQCAFSAVAANLYTGRVITIGTLIAVFLSTSDEMLPMMLSENMSASFIFPILGYKLFVAILMGFVIDFICKLTNRNKEEINIDEICENDNCHCERGIFYSAIHHTLTISAFVFVITLIINALIFFIGTDTIGEALGTVPVLANLIAAFIGLIPGCATSVALTSLGLHGIISTGAMLSGLFSSAGVGILILTRLNKRRKENLMILLLLVAIGFVFGLIADLIGFSTVIS